MATWEKVGIIAAIAGGFFTVIHVSNSLAETSRETRRLFRPKYDE